jgi:isopenicillin-N N-acyltransferase-like protein
MLQKSFLCVTTFCLLLCYVAADYCRGHPDPNAKPNLSPILTEAPIFVKSVTNGKLFNVNAGDHLMKIVHVYGDPYQMGYAHGSLLKQDLNTFYPMVWKYMVTEFEHEMEKKIPKWLADLIAEYGLDIALDLTYEATVRYTGPHIYQEMKGIADGASVDYKTLRRIHMIGELTKGSCSMFGAWGNATKSTGGSTLQLRAFDWEADGPFKDYATVIVYHPNDLNNGTKKSYKFANLGFAGWIGSFSGISENQLAISEIGVFFRDDTFGTESRLGIPFTFLLRDILQFDLTLDDSINRITTVKRTCDLILGVGDGKLGQVRSFQYSSSVARVIDDINILPKNDSWHPAIQNVVYHGMDWLCPGFNKVLGEQLQKFHGDIRISNVISDIVAKTQTGNLQVSIYDLTNMMLYLSYARPTNGTGNKYAYERSYIKFDMKKLFAEPKP